MKVELKASGYFEISAENELEAYALKKMAESVFVEGVSVPWLVINHSTPTND